MLSILLLIINNIRINMDDISNQYLVSGFWEIYSCLSKEEAGEFAGFIESGAFSKNRQLNALVNTFLRMHKKKVVLSRELIYEETFPGKKYNQQLFNNYVSELKKLLQKFLEIRWMESRPQLKQLALAESYLKMGLLSRYEKSNPTEKVQILIQSTQDEMFYAFRLQSLKDEFLATQSKKRRYDLLEPALFYFREYYFLETMRMYCELINRKNLRSQDFSEADMHLFLQYFHDFKKLNQISPLLELYFMVISFLKDIDDEFAYDRYKELLVEHISSLPPKIARELSLFGQNQCVKHINLSHEKYLKELFDLYNLMLNQNIIYDGPYMTQYTFKNYVTVALRLKAFDEAIQFVETSYLRLLPDQRSNALHYNLAAIYFEKNDFEKAMDELNQIQISDPVYYLDSRSILLKIYFEDADLDALNSLYHSVRAYLLRSRKFPKKQADLYRYLFLYTNKLAQLMLKKQFLGKKEFQIQLQLLEQKVKIATIANKTWLLGKIEQEQSGQAAFLK